MSAPTTAEPLPFFITTAIDYTNGAPHIGHAYEKVLADVIARYHRLKGGEVFFLTGVDQHGQKVQQSAEKEGVAPQEFVDNLTQKFIALWAKLGVEYDAWAATTDPRHKDCVRRILARLNDEGQIYKAARAGFYSVRQEQFLTDKERGEDGQFGAEWGLVEFREEENYYFRLVEHKDWLLGLLERRSASGAPLVRPDFRVAELRNALERLEGDLCISRPKQRLAWGIEFPFDPDYVTYVWFDALVNYISFAPGYDPEPGAELAVFHHWWPALHVIGKDILIPAHGVYWPIMLKALGFADDDIPPLLVHGWWNIAGAKMSKSTGNIVDPDQLADRYGAEALRYYLMSDIATGRDADFSEERLILRYNGDLANNLGNLLNRTLSMAAKFRASVLAKPGEFPLLDSLPVETFFARAARRYCAHCEGAPPADHATPEAAPATQPAPAAWAEYRIEAALEEAIAIGRAANQLVQTQAPWELAKAEKLGDSAAAVRLDATLYTLAEALRIAAILLSPVMPRAAQGIFDQLGWKGRDAAATSTGAESVAFSPRFQLAEARWGLLPAGHTLGQPIPLFPRLEAPLVET